MNERYRRIHERTNRAHIPRPKVASIGQSMGNTSHLHRHKTVWETHADKPTKWRIVFTLRDWFRV